MGTDYFSYMKLFVGRESLSRYIDNGELLFVFLIRFCHNIGIYGQGILLVIVFIEVILYFYISIKIFGFYLLYIFVSQQYLIIK